MEEATGAPSSSTVYDPRRLRASGRDGGGVMNRPPSPLTMLLSRHTRRREFIAGLGGAAVWPLAAGAQQAAVPLIGFLDWPSPQPKAGYIGAFRQGLAENGYVEGRNVAIEFRWANTQSWRMPDLAAELVQHQVTVIVAVNASSAARAAKAATSTIPIVFVYGGDPLADGLVTSMSRPAANVTGVTTFTIGLGGKRLSLLCNLVPQATTVAFLSGDSSFLHHDEQIADILGAAHAQGRQIVPVEFHGRDRDYEAAFTTLTQQRAAGLVVGAFTFRNGNRIAMLAARHRIPTIYPGRGFVAAGGLMSYSATLGDIYRQAGIYTGLVLKGRKPAELPVFQPTKFEFVINLKAASAIGLEIPPTMLAIADEVIE
jgi:putative tryptophan/tyrosine transport system substrate-binding protein